MELLQLKYFIAAAKCEHITRAAELLRIAQPALTQSIKRLEAELGTRLFERSGRSIELNDAGRLLLRRAESIVADIEALPDEVQKASGISEGTIHMNIAAASYIITKIIISYKKLHPRLNISVTHGESDRHCDISITSDAYDKSDYKSDYKENDINEKNRAIISEDIMLAVPSDSKYAAEGSIRLEEASNEYFISLTGALPLREICDQLCISAGFLPRVAFESDSSDAVRDLIAANMGIAFWPAFSWGPPKKENVSLIPISSPICRRSLIITKNSSTPQGMLTDFYKYTVNEINKLKSAVSQAYS